MESVYTYKHGERGGATPMRLGSVDGFGVALLAPRMKSPETSKKRIAFLDQPISEL